MTQDTYILESLGQMEEDDVVISKDAVRYEIRNLMKQGIYHQEELFALLYPIYAGHYSVLRDIISEEKNYA
jgi:hypothetical protein